jgi:hypothetical protein
MSAGILRGEQTSLTQRRKDAKESRGNAVALCAFAPLREKFLPLFLILCLLTFTVSACRGDTERGRVPTEVQEVVTSVGDQMAQERYEQIYNESSELWKKDATLEQSNQVFKTLREKLGKVESRSLHSATEQQNSGGTLKGHVFILSYQTRFERGEAMETFTLIEDNGRWLLARYFVNSTALK